MRIRSVIATKDFPLPGGASIKVRPITPALLLQVREMQPEVEQTLAAQTTSVLDEDGMFEVTPAITEAAFAISLFYHSVHEWSGILDDETGETAEFSVFNIAVVLSHNPTNQAFFAAANQQSAFRLDEPEKFEAA